MKNSVYLSLAVKSKHVHFDSNSLLNENVVSDSDMSQYDMYCIKFFREDTLQCMS